MFRKLQWVILVAATLSGCQSSSPTRLTPGAWKVCTPDGVSLREAPVLTIRSADPGALDGVLHLDAGDVQLSLLQLDKDFNPNLWVHSELTVDSTATFPTYEQGQLGPETPLGAGVISVEVDAAIPRPHVQGVAMLILKGAKPDRYLPIVLQE